MFYVSLAKAIFDLSHLMTNFPISLIIGKPFDLFKLAENQSPCNRDLEQNPSLQCKIQHLIKTEKSRFHSGKKRGNVHSTNTRTRFI